LITLKKILLSVLLLSGFSLCSAQTLLNVPYNIQRTYLKGTRTLNGRPGKNYWQNTAAYNIKVKFDPKSRNLSGTVDIVYTNNSPDTLKQLWFKLYPNFYQHGVLHNFKVDPKDMGDGVTIRKMTVNDADIDLKTTVMDGTNLSLNVPPVLSKQKTHITFDYNYTVNKGSHVRTGQIDSAAYLIAYFFPRITVYDDIDGWNKYPYLGTEEFYNDFSHFNLEITVPGDYMVWATGDLVNKGEVYNSRTINLINQAERTDSITTVVSQADLAARSVLVNKPFNTWKFEADNVPDVAFATSNHYSWQSTSLVVDSLTKRRTRVDAVFNPIHKDYFNVVGYSRKVVDYMSFKFPKWPFPYSHETVVDGLDQMEYPMMANDNPLDKPEDEVELTSHEIFHTMFPFYMGTNETKYGWMDEGWATLGEWTLSNMIMPTAIDVDGMANYEASAGREDDQPIITLTTQITGNSAMINSYPKPALGYMYVKDMLGEEVFNRALHYYIEQWHGKHPMPYDFFNCMNTGAGTNLNWFWRNWFLQRGAPDLGITSVTRKTKHEYQVIVTNIGTKYVPVNLTVYYKNKTTRQIHRDISCWRNGNTTIALTVPADKQVVKIVLGGNYYPDINKADNGWMPAR
jgi:hypothetical protein